MKSTSRKFLKCMFCGSDGPITKEHIFGAAVSNHFRELPHAKVQRNAAVDPATKYDPQYRSSWHDFAASPLSFTSHSMCSSCNNFLGEELSDLSLCIAEFFKGRLLHTTGQFEHTIPQRYVALALRYFQRIGILIDLETAKFDPDIMKEAKADQQKNFLTRRFPPVISSSERAEFREGGTLSRVGVYLGVFRGRSGDIVPINIANGFTPFKDAQGSKLRPNKCITFTVKGVTCFIEVGVDHANQNPKLVRLEDTTSAFRLNPNNASSDRDIFLNYAAVTRHIDGSVGPPV